MLTKRCSKCKTEKPLSEFHKAPHNKDGLCGKCKVCILDYMRVRLAGRPFNDSWRHMIDRCYRSQHPHFKNYGARGIEVCASWRESYEAYRDFRLSLGDSMESPLSLDRINNDGNYEPSNCSLATQSQQMLNQRKRTGKLGVPQSKYIGVHWCNNNGKWYSHIMINGKRKHIGSFKTESEAVATRSAVMELIA